MPRDARAYLWDVRASADAIAGFIDGATADDYHDNALLRSAVERQLEIIGEALNQMTKIAPEWADEIPHCRDAIGLRNILIHGYIVIDDAIVWRTVERDLPALRQHVDALLRAQDPGTAEE